MFHIEVLLGDAWPITIALALAHLTVCIFRTNRPGASWSLLWSVVEAGLQSAVLPRPTQGLGVLDRHPWAAAVGDWLSNRQRHLAVHERRQGVQGHALHWDVSTGCYTLHGLTPLSCFTGEALVWCTPDAML